MDKERKELCEQILDVYRDAVSRKYPDKFQAWPVLSGYNLKTGRYKNYMIPIFEHTGNLVTRTQSGVGDLPASIVGVQEINDSNKERVREKLERHFSLKSSDGIVFLSNGENNIMPELNKMLTKHELAMGLTPMRIFLSHKGIDKVIVRDIKKTLELLGFDPWLDEDAMHAGVELERGILQGIKDSCAAIFFITPNFEDEQYLQSEINYSMAEKRKKSDNFVIITLVFSQDGESVEVPELLKQYVWKEPKTDLEALREILKALPVKPGSIQWRS